METVSETPAPEARPVAERLPAAPPVVCAMAVYRPGPWFADTLAALAAQVRQRASEVQAGDVGLAAGHGMGEQSAEEAVGLAGFVDQHAGLHFESGGLRDGTGFHRRWLFELDLQLLFHGADRAVVLVEAGAVAQRVDVGAGRRLKLYPDRTSQVVEHLRFVGAEPNERQASTQVRSSPLAATNHLLLPSGTAAGITTLAQIVRSLAARDILFDFREPDLIRAGCSPLTTRFVDVFDGLRAVADLAG